MITFDVDSVLLQTEEKIIREIKRIYNEEITLMDISYWNYYKDRYPKIMDLFNCKNFYKDISPVNNMNIILGKIIKKYGYNNIQLVTSTPNTLKIPKEECLNKHFGNIKNFSKIEIIHVGLYLDELNTNHEKHHFTKNTVLIDDAIHNIDSHVKNNNKEALLIDYGYGWNQNYSHNLVTRIKNPNEILLYLNNLINLNNN